MNGSCWGILIKIDISFQWEYPFLILHWAESCSSKAKSFWGAKKWPYSWPKNSQECLPSFSFGILPLGISPPSLSYSFPCCGGVVVWQNSLKHYHCPCNVYSFSTWSIYSNMPWHGKHHGKLCDDLWNLGKLDNLLSELQIFHAAVSAEPQASVQYLCMPSIRKWLVVLVADTGIR